MVTPSLEVDPACGCAPRVRGRTVSGGHGDGVTPVPISNTAVKPISADGTWGVAPWESRTPPGFLRQKPLAMRGAFVALWGRLPWGRLPWGRLPWGPLFWGPLFRCPLPWGRLQESAACQALCGTSCRQHGTSQTVCGAVGWISTITAGSPAEDSEGYSGLEGVAERRPSLGAIR